MTVVIIDCSSDSTDPTEEAIQAIIADYHLLNNAASHNMLGYQRDSIAFLDGKLRRSWTKEEVGSQLYWVC